MFFIILQNKIPQRFISNHLIKNDALSNVFCVLGKDNSHMGEEWTIRWILQFLNTVFID